MTKVTDLEEGLFFKVLHPPPLYDGDDIIDLDLEFVRLIKVLQSTHVCGHGLQTRKDKKKYT